MRILHSLLSELPPAESEFERQVFEFCLRWREGETAFLFHSSGSTGDPKPILITRERMYASAKMTGEWLKLAKPNNVVFLFGNTIFMLGFGPQISLSTTVMLNLIQHLRR